MTHPRLPHIACTLDAWRADDNTVIDCKALSAYRKLDEACAFYLPQMVVQRGCVSADGASLLVVHGGAEPKEFPLTIPADYAATVWVRIDEFWQCVLDLTPPVVMAPIAAPVPAIVEYDMSTSNQWAVEAAAWLEHRGAAKRFAAAEKELKSLIPQDGKRAFGFGVEATRDKAGRLSLKEARA